MIVATFYTLLAFCKLAAERIDNIKIRNGISDPRMDGSVDATWYGDGFNGQEMANGNPYWAWRYICACNHYPLGTILKVRRYLNNPMDYKEVIVTVTDRTDDKTYIDLSEIAFNDIGYLYEGRLKVFIVSAENSNVE